MQKGHGEHEEEGSKQEEEEAEESKGWREGQLNGQSTRQEELERRMAAQDMSLYMSDRNRFTIWASLIAINGLPEADESKARHKILDAVRAVCFILRLVELSLKATLAMIGGRKPS